MRRLSELLSATAALLCLLGFAAGRRPAEMPGNAPAELQRREESKPLPRRLLPWLPRRAFEELPAGDAAPDGTEPQVELPPGTWFKNIGSKIDGKGMCVFTAFELLCLQLGHDEFRGFRDWCAAKFPGGGWPEKLAQCVAAYCKEKGLKVPLLQQYEGSDVAWLERAVNNGQLCMVTLFHSDRYRDRSQRVLPIIYHMTNLANCDGRWLAIQDNNFETLEWWPMAEGLKAISNQGQFWAVCVPEWAAPPPVPRN